MFTPVEIKLRGTCTDLLSLSKVFESIHRTALVYAPGFHRGDNDQEFNVTVSFSGSGSTVQVIPVQSDENVTAEDT